MRAPSSVTFHLCLPDDTKQKSSHVLFVSAAHFAISNCFCFTFTAHRLETTKQLKLHLITITFLFLLFWGGISGHFKIYFVFSHLFFIEVIVYFNLFYLQYMIVLLVCCVVCCRPCTKASSTTFVLMIIKLLNLHLYLLSFCHMAAVR